jgi:hypothetical protein
VQHTRSSAPRKPSVHSGSRSRMLLRWRVCDVGAGSIASAALPPPAPSSSCCSGPDSTATALQPAPCAAAPCLPAACAACALLLSLLLSPLPRALLSALLWPAPAAPPCTGFQ